MTRHKTNGLRQKRYVRPRSETSTMQQLRSKYAMKGGAIGALIGLLVIASCAAIGALLYYFFSCPCERTPGGYLLGEEISEAVADWSFANDVRLCQIEVKRLLPHSVNLNCMSAGGELFLSCAGCEGKTWSTAAMNNPLARIRLNDRVYPVRLSRLTDPARLDLAWRAREEKLGRSPDRPRQAGWWSFAVVSR